MTTSSRLGAVVAVALIAAAVLSTPLPASAAPPAGDYKLRNQYDAKCVEGDLAHVHDNVAHAQLWDCYADPGNQVWSLVPYGSAYKLVNRAAAKCLESDLAHSGNGTPVQLWDCWNDPGNQQWRIVASPYAGYGAQVVNVLTGQCLDADLGHITANGDRLQLWGCWADPGNERFSFYQVP